METALLLAALLLGPAAAITNGNKGKGKGKPSQVPRASRVRREEAEINALGLRVRDLMEGNGVPGHLIDAMQQLLTAQYPM